MPKRAADNRRGEQIAALCDDFGQLVIGEFFRAAGCKRRRGHPQGARLTADAPGPTKRGLWAYRCAEAICRACGCV